MEQSYYVPFKGAEEEAAAADTATEDRGDFAGAPFEYFQPTSATKSVWADNIQHGGPPIGLLTRAMSRLDAPVPQQFTRISTEILGAVGLGVNRVRARILRPGKQISLVGAELQVQQANGTFRAAARASAWRLRVADSTAISASLAEPLTPSPEEIDTNLGFGASGADTVAWGTEGFIGTVRTGIVDGRVGETPAIWLRPAIDLVAGETMTDLESVLTVVDVANGVGTLLDPAEWTWMNLDTTVHLSSVPSGPWLGIDGQMSTGETGFGASFADLYDRNGFVGRSAQTVLLSPAG